MAYQTKVFEWRDADGHVSGLLPTRWAPT